MTVFMVNNDDLSLIKNTKVFMVFIFIDGRQMKTIQFSLASPKTMEEGWAILPRTPSPESPTKDEDTFQVEVNSTLLQVRKKP